ncbi:MAG: phosphoglycerate kinase [Clostridia bacterium]|nr:MAG: phosphoglycerate kinase [Clostridia bacterium]
MNKLTVRDVEVSGKRILVRVDFNVPLDDAGQVTDATRIRAARPTINYLVERQAKVILASHLGRPKGQPDPKYSLAPAARCLSDLLGREVRLAPDCVGPQVQSLVAVLDAGEVLLLENLRFHPEEEKNEAEFARELASLADLYVNDAFGTAHRAHASTAGVAAHLPAVAGFLMEKEIIFLEKVTATPQQPLVACLGGAKVSDKIGVITNLLEVADKVLVGGGMANTFLKAQGYEVGRSLVEDDRLETARDILARGGDRLILPEDVVVAPEGKPGVPYREVGVDQVPADWMILDIGPRTAWKFAAAVEGAATVIWNGPMGLFEVEPFDRGTKAVAEAMSRCPGTTVVGGGDSVAAVEKAGVADRVTHISTGGGATLEFLEGKELPGVAALNDKR